MQIWFESKRVATLTPGTAGPSLTYNKEWLDLPGAFAISYTLPLSQKPYSSGSVAPWLVNLLPEGANLDVIAKLTGIGQGDVLGLLSKIGRDTSGALSFAARGTAQMQTRRVESEGQLERIINELPSKPFLVGDEGVSLSLAGVQDKLSVHLGSNGSLGIPINGAPSTWILKPDSPRLWGSVYNEAFCLILADQIGLAAPEVRLGRAGQRRYLLIRRYDRRAEGRHWRRLHQEDLCQAMGIFPSAKYETNQSGTPGPKFRDLMAVVRSAAGLAATLQLLRYMIFNVICCNTDAHAKNYSFLLSARGAEMAPIYDVMCAKVWPQVTPNLANTIAGKNRGDVLKARHWRKEANACGLNPSATLRQVESLCQQVQAALPRAYERIIEQDPNAKAMADQCQDAIIGRCRALLNGLQDKQS